MQKFEDRESVIIENEGQKIFAVLHKPIFKRSDKIPAVLMCHGFAGNKTGKFRIYVSLAERLAKEGIASLRIDFRGSGDSEGEFSEMTVESEVSDALKGLNFLSKLKDVDPERIGLLGNSFGGAIAVLAASQFGKIKSLVLLAALFSNKKWRKQWDAIKSSGITESSSKELLRAFDGNIPGPNFYSSFFNLDIEPQLGKLKNIPLLHIHSILDERVTIDEAHHYKRCRSEAIAETRFLQLEKCDHSFSNADERIEVLIEAVNWFKKTL